jgi:predicted transcriptional regulator
MKERVVTAHIPQELAAEVDTLAERLDRPRGWIVKEALKRFVELEQERYQLTRDALRDVDSGRTEDHEAVERWASELLARQRSAHR